MVLVCNSKRAVDLTRSGSTTNSAFWISSSRLLMIGSRWKSRTIPHSR